MQHKDVFELLFILTEKEKKALVSTIKRKTKKKTYSNELIFFLLSQKKLPTKEQVVKAVYKTGSYYSEEAYCKLVQRTASDIMEMLNASISKDTGSFEEIDLGQIEIYQKLALLQYIIGKKSIITSVIIIREQIMRLAIELELYQLLIEQLYQKKYDVALLEGEKAALEIEKKIAHFERCDIAFRKAPDLYLLIKEKSLQTTVHEKSIYRAMLQKHIGILVKEYRLSKSPTVKYYLIQHQISLCYLNEDYQKAKKKCFEILELMRSNVSIRRKSRIGIMYDNLAKCDIYLKNYLEAIDYVKVAQGHYEPQSRNCWISLELEFVANLQMQNFKRAKEILENIVTGHKKSKSYFERDMLRFYKAILLFENGELQSAFSILNEKLEISKDSIGWNFWARVMCIQINVLLKKEDKASAAVVSLKKQMQRISKDKSFRERDNIIFKILFELHNKVFSTNISIPKVKLLLSKLSEKKNEWKPFTAELIPFETLFKAKYKGY